MVSTTTTTGMGELQKRLTAEVGKIYYPIDRRKFVHRAICIIHPTAIVLVEAEVWPNFMWRAQDSRIPVFLVNARLSDRSFPRYKRFPTLFQPLFGSFTAVAAQSEEYAARLRDVGCRPETVQVLGNMKFDTAKLSSGKNLDVPAMLAKLGVPADAPILLGGSTHPGKRKSSSTYFRGCARSIRSCFSSSFRGTSSAPGSGASGQRSWYKALLPDPSRSSECAGANRLLGRR
jgi:3-deoxy-D-manno-octulosonic-acid transferase